MSGNLLFILTHFSQYVLLQKLYFRSMKATFFYNNSRAT